MLLKERQKEREAGREGKEEDVSRCLMTLKKRVDAGICKMALCGELGLEEAVDFFARETTE